MPRDAAARERLVTQFDRNLLVEAGAGSGKTYSLAARMAAGIAAGAFSVERMAAVTFTRKAAAELRGRFGLALEERLRAAPPAAERERLEAALSGIERLFAGTIHAFCAHLLRERPVDADLAPGFTDLDEVENARRQQQAWRDYVAMARASGARPVLDLLAAGVRPSDLDNAFATICEHEDVEFDHGDGAPPDFDETLRRVERFWSELAQLKPPAFRNDTLCRAQQKYDEFDGRLNIVTRHGRIAGLARLLIFWGNTEVTQVWWSQRVGRDPSFGARAKALADSFRADSVAPFLTQWRAYVHRLSLDVLDEARREYAAARRRQNVVNDVDLLQHTVALLRDRAHVRHALQQKYRWLFVDEFQDTDPLQAEIFLMLAADEATAGPAAAQTAPPCDPFALPLRAGALFVVGDPKQSIYRFRRADIDTYLRVRERIERTGGEVLSLTANFRSQPGVCALANTVFPPLFARFALPHSPAFEPLDPVRPSAGERDTACVARLTVPADGTSIDRVRQEAERIAAFIHGEVVAGRRRYGDFLVLTRSTPRLGVYAEALDALEVPVEVSGAGAFRLAPEVRALALLLRTLADPLDAVSLVGVLRGPLFGLSDPELFQFRQAGGRLELAAPLPEAPDAATATELGWRYGPVLPAMRRLHAMLDTTRRLPLAAAVHAMLETTGWLALASVTPGGARAGHLLQAVDHVRQVAEDGGGLFAAASALDAEESAEEVEALPLRPGRRDVVRLMNLHKAKGLEAPVVFLADAGHAFQFATTVRIVREGGRARGYLRIVRAVADKPWLTTLVGEPVDWARHEQAERPYREAEKLRLLYVAGTRARDLLVVCRIDDPRKNKAWGAFEAYLQPMPELPIPNVQQAARRQAPDLSAAARRDAEAGRGRRHARAVAPSWAVVTPSGLKTVQPELAAGDAATTAAQDSGAGGGADAGAAWGALVHGLLEHAMRHPGATRADLGRLARWLTLEQPALRAVVSEAVQLVEAVTRAPFWAEARAGGEVHAEVPFAVRVEADTSIPGAAVVETPTVLRGVIDLVYRAADGWRILDYKTDRLEGVEDPDAELRRRRYGAQLASYARAWQHVSGAAVSAPSLVALREMRIVPGE